MDDSESGGNILGFCVFTGRDGQPEFASLEQVQRAFGSNEAMSINLLARQLISDQQNSMGNPTKIFTWSNEENIQFLDADQTITMQPTTRGLINQSNSMALNWATGQTFDTDDVLSFDWLSRTLHDTEENAVACWASGSFLLSEGYDIHTGTAFGSRFGATIAQRIAFHGAIASVQRTGAVQAAVATTALTTGAIYSQAEATALATRCTALTVLVNELRAALVEKGLIKGAA